MSNVNHTPATYQRTRNAETMTAWWRRWIDQDVTTRVNRW